MHWEELLSRGRFRPTKRVDGETRDEFERDYGRALYSTPVRRLRDKAQVFPLEPHDSVRTRLAHSLEVSSVAEGLAVSAERLIPELNSLSDQEQRNIACIARTCGLIHDLGNPPFGHAGELAIATWFKDRLKSDSCFKGRFERELTKQHQEDLLAFEGNAQTIRLVCHLQLLTDQLGLNFTYGTLSAASKYLAASDTVRKDGPHQRRKPGYFASEQKEIFAVREATGSGDRRNPIAYLVEAADDIVYSTVDLEDGLKKKVLDWDEVEQCLKNTSLGHSVIKETHARVDGKGLTGSSRKNAYAIVFRTVAISVMAPAAIDVFKKRYRMIMMGEYDGELVTDEECTAKDLIEASKKQILRTSLYTDPSILKLEVRGRAVIHGLMDLFWEAVEFADPSQQPQTRDYAGKLFLLMSDNYRRVFQLRLGKGDQPELYTRLQLVADQVAGMTDTHACRLHKDLYNG
jgi:dGTPase